MIAVAIYGIFALFAYGNESPFNIATQTGLAGYIWYVGGMGWLIGWLVIMMLVAVSRD
jgi:predicted PurR-regulated permease PerM